MTHNEWMEDECGPTHRLFVKYRKRAVRLEEALKELADRIEYMFKTNGYTENKEIREWFGPEIINAYENAVDVLQEGEE